MTSASVFRSVLWAMTVNALCILPSFLVGALAVDIRREFDFSDTVAGLAFSGFWLVASLSAVPFSRLVTRVGVDAALRLAATITILLTSGIAIIGHGVIPFIVLLVLAGAATALATPAVNVRVMSVVSPRRQAFAITAAGASPVLSLMAAGIIAGVLGPVVAWQWIFGGVAVVLAGLVIIRRRSAGSPSPGASSRGPIERPRLLPLVRVMILIGAGNAVVGAATSFLVLAAPGSGVQPTVAALVVGIVSATSIAVRLVLAATVDRTRSDPLPLVTGLIAAGVVGLVLIGTGVPWAYFAGMVLVLVPGWSWVSLLLFGVLARYRHAVAAASGVVQMVFFVGGVIGPLGMGLALTALPYAAAWWLLGGFMCVAAIAAWWARSTLPAFVSE